MTDDHNHKDYEVETSLICGNCGEKEIACAYCGEPLHVCIQTNKLPKGFRVIPEYPDYMVNSHCTVKHISTNRYCLFMRLSKTGGAMVLVKKDGRPHTVAAQDLKRMAFDARE
jgi:hypothetical protein